MRVKKTEEEKANKQLKLVIKMYLISREMTQIQLAARINMPLSTFNDRWMDPGKFRRSELMAIFAVLQVRQEDKEKIPW
nr:MAG TPA: transcription repressor [Caudoviricetes sp.]